MVQVQDVPGLMERLLGFLDIGKDFVTAETIVQVRAELYVLFRMLERDSWTMPTLPVALQVKDLARKYPDIAEVCVGSVSNISLEVGSSTPLSPASLTIHILCLV